MREVFRVSSHSDSAKLASAVSHRVKNGQDVQLDAIGASAVNQAVKAVAIARGFLTPTGMDVACCPSFNVVDLNGEDKTMITLTIKKGTT